MAHHEQGIECRIGTNRELTVTHDPPGPDSALEVTLSRLADEWPPVSPLPCIAVLTDADTESGS